MDEVLDISKKDFSGWATKNDIRCSDGRTIRRDAFKDADGTVVPLVWSHDHQDINNVLGHALLENRPEGVYAYCFLNNSDNGNNARVLVQNGDIRALSIYANQLKQSNGDVVHGTIRELSLVLSPANPGAYIDSITHSDDEEGIILVYSDTTDKLSTSNDDKGGQANMAANNTSELIHTGTGVPPIEPNVPNPAAPGAGEEKSLQEVFNTLTEEQKSAVEELVGLAVEEAKNEKEGNQDNMNHNAFDNNEAIGGEDDTNCVLTHDAFATVVKIAASGNGSLKEAFAQAAANGKDYLAHADKLYGIKDPSILFPDAQSANVGKYPAMIKRNTEWVEKFMRGVSHTPFSRIRTTYVDMTEEQLRAKGYITGTEKVGSAMAAFKRITEPQTVYKNESLDRDDIIDITDFDAVMFLKQSMETLLREEVARAMLLGDGRAVDDTKKIDPMHIRPIWQDTSAYTINRVLTPTSVNSEDEATANKNAIALIRDIVRSRKLYEGSGNPTLFTTEDDLAAMLLITDSTGRDIYDDIAKLVTKLRVKEIVTVKSMEGLTRISGDKTYELHAILVNPNDYTSGADKGGEVNLFEDFDINFNKKEYLIETRISGALTVPHSAISFEYQRPVPAQG